MEGMNREKINYGLPPTCPKRQTDSVPSAHSAFQVWKKPYLMSYEGTKPYCPAPEPKTFHLPLANDANKTTQTPPPPSDKNLMISGGDNSVKVTESETTNVDTRWARQIERNMDPRKLRRIMSNRVSAQKSRMKKLQYVTDMEKQAKALEAQIAVLHPQVILHRNQQELLEREKESLNQRLITFTNNTRRTDAEIEENKAEVTRLWQLHLAQQQKMQGQIMLPVWESGLDKMIMNSGLFRNGLQQMVYENPNQGQYLENTEEMLRQKQLQMKQAAAQNVNDQAEADRVDPLNMNQQQQNPTNDMLIMPGWETGVVQMPNTSFNTQSGPPPNANMIINSNMGGIEQILSLNINNVSQDPRNGFI